MPHIQSQVVRDDSALTALALHLPLLASKKKTKKHYTFAINSLGLNANLDIFEQRKLAQTSMYSESHLTVNVKFDPAHNFLFEAMVVPV